MVHKVNSSNPESFFQQTCLIRFGDDVLVAEGEGHDADEEPEEELRKLVLFRLNSIPLQGDAGWSGS